jgi:flagellar protein FlaJ
VNGYSLVLMVVFLLLLLTELLAIPAALGQLVVFSQFGLAFVTFYPALIGLLVAALAGAVVLAAGRPAPPRTRASHQSALAWGSAAGAFLLAALGMATGAFERIGLHAERSVFVLAASLVATFFFVKAWLRLPTYADVSEWLEREQRVSERGLLRKVVYVLVGVALAGVVVALVVSLGLGPRPVGLVSAGLAMLALLGATFNVGVSHVVPALEMGLANAADERKKRRIVLAACSIALSVLALAIGSLTLAALLAQVGGVTLFRFLLDFYVQQYPLIFALALLPPIAAVVVRTRTKSEVAYSDRLKALALGMATVSIILVFFGVFIGSGLAQGSGIAIENAVLVMGAAILTLVQFVKARALLPSIGGLIRESVAKTQGADEDTKHTIQNRMIATYVTALVFVVVFLGFFMASALGVIKPPTASLGRDVGFFVYVLLGIALLVVVVMRYLQSVNMDSRWATRKQKQDIGKRRLTSEEVKRYLILGFSIGAAVLLALLGVLVQMGLLRQLGPLPVAKKYSTDFFVFAILIGLGPYGWYQGREAKRIEAIDAKFPEFLRDLAESQRSGMTLTEAVATAAKGSYGVLTSEIRKMAAQIEWGVSFADALTRFSNRVPTPLVKRTVALVIQASSAGGNVVDVLTAAADDAREIQQIVKERKQSMSIYLMIIYIAFAVFVGVIAVLNAQFIPEVAKAVSKADGVSIGGLHFHSFNQDDFKTLFFHAAIIQGFGGGIVGGVMSGGKPVHGLKHSFLLVLVAWVLFRVVIG